MFNAWPESVEKEKERGLLLFEKMNKKVCTESENGIDISKLRQETGYITLDPGYANTGSCKSDITFIDGDKGILRYRGYPIENLAGKVKFTDVAYLLLNGELPDSDSKENFCRRLRKIFLQIFKFLIFFIKLFFQKIS